MAVEETEGIERTEGNRRTDSRKGDRGLLRKQRTIERIKSGRAP
jgi:hypothetical protein